MIMRSIFTQASVQLHFLCFCLHSVFLFSVFFVVFFFCFCFCSAFFTIAIVKQPHYKRISLHLQLHQVLHPVTLCCIRSAVVLLGLPAYAFSLFTILGLSTIAISDSTLLWIVQRLAFALYIDPDTFTLLPGWIILINLGARRQKSQALRPCFGTCQLFFVKLCQVYASYLYHHLRNLPPHEN